MCTLRVFHTDQVSIGADRFGRKPMLLFSCGGMSLAMATMTGYYWCFAAKEWVLVGKETWEWASFVAMTLYVLQSLPNTRSAKGWAVNSASVWRAVQQRVFDYHWSGSTRSCAEAELNRCRYMFFNQAGLGPLAAVVTTEIVDSTVRGLAMGVATMGAGLIAAGTNYVTLPIVDSIGYDWMFAGCGPAAGCPAAWLLASLCGCRAVSHRHVTPRSRISLAMRIPERSLTRRDRL